MLLSRETPEGPKIMEVIAIPIGYLPELDRETILLKTSHTLVLRHREIKLETPPHCWLTFIVLEGTMQATQ